MKLFRFGQPGLERPGVFDPSGIAIDVSAIVGDYDPATLGPALVEKLSTVTAAHHPAVDLAGERLGPPLARPGTIWCIGLNYRDHAHEAGMSIPDEPVVFSKAASALSGPSDAIPFSDGMTKLDWEVELGIVIGTAAFDVAEGAALDHVFGYTLINDVSERAWQLERGGQWIKGKSHPGFCPAGPWLVTRDGVADPQNLRLWLDVNGDRRQDGSTAAMIFPAAQIISYLSRFARLEPGDLICTGTPAGVGAGFKPPVFLSPGDRLELGIDGLGMQCQIVARR
ncbi:2,4-diketo-3-deoxy-L-fuconate hydrolase [Sphingomonas sp. UYAg733]